MPYQLVTFDGLTLPIYYKEGDSVIGTVEIGDDYIKLPGGRTWDARKGERARPWNQRYTMQCLLLGSSAADLQTQESALIAKDGVKGVLTRQDQAGNSQTLTARLSIPEVSERIGGQLARMMTLVFDVAEPGWLGTNRNGSSDSWGSPVAAVNNGDYPYYAPVLTLTGSTGAGPDITDFIFEAGPDSAGRVWKWAWAGTLAATKALVINCATFQVTNDGAADYGLTLDATHNQNELMIVPNGGLTFTAQIGSSGFGADPTLTWTSYDVYR